jgi:hypothetical protein
MKTLREGHGLGGAFIGKYTNIDTAKQRAREWSKTFHGDKYRYGDGNTHDVLLTWTGKRWTEERT